MCNTQVLYGTLDSWEDWIALFSQAKTSAAMLEKAMDIRGCQTKKVGSALEKDSKNIGVFSLVFHNVFPEYCNIQ